MGMEMNTKPGSRLECTAQPRLLGQAAGATGLTPARQTTLQNPTQLPQPWKAITVSATPFAPTYPLSLLASISVLHNEGGTGDTGSTKAEDPSKEGKRSNGEHISPELL